MKKYKLLTKPTEVSAAIDFEDSYDDVGNWQFKAARWQTRQQRKLKHQLI